MTRQEYNDFRYIKSTAKKYGQPGHGCQYTIPTDASPDYKARLHELYTSWNLHPAAVRVDRHYFDDRERIIYIFGRDEKYIDTFGNVFTWEALYTTEEKARFAAALL
jgi:hypothetical protein